MWRDLVATGQLAALVRDTPALQWLANTAPLCNVAVLPEQIEPFDYGIAFHVNTSEAVVDAWSGAILKLQASGERLGRGAPLVGWVWSSSSCMPDIWQGPWYHGAGPRPAVLSHSALVTPGCCRFFMPPAAGGRNAAAAEGHM